MYADDNEDQLPPRRSTPNHWVNRLKEYYGGTGITDTNILVGYGDVGGFGAGSDFTWQVALGAAYDFSKTISGKFGYRYLSVDYDKGGFAYDMKTRGVHLGLGIRF